MKPDPEGYGWGRKRELSSTTPVLAAGPLFRETCRKDPAQPRAPAAGPAFMTRRCDSPDGWTHSVHPHPRSRHNVVRLFPQCSWMVRQVPQALPQWRSCRGYRGIIPRLLRGCPCPGGRDGASVQFYICTVIEDYRKIFRNINFVVEMSDSGD